jgi:hypothetical protein
MAAPTRYKKIKMRHYPTVWHIYGASQIRGGWRIGEHDRFLEIRQQQDSGRQI